jgi:non-ribosomal peptide synthetase component F
VGQTYRHNLSSDLTQHVIQFSRNANATPFMTLLAAYQLLLARYAGQDDVVVGSPIANRNRSEIENLIGFFVNMLVLRTQIGPDESFNSLLGQVRQHALDGFNHQDVPFEKLVDALNVRRDMSFPPVFQVAFIMQNAPRSEIDLGEITMSVVPAEGTTAKYDLTLIGSGNSRWLPAPLGILHRPVCRRDDCAPGDPFHLSAGKCADPAAAAGGRTAALFGRRAAADVGSVERYGTAVSPTTPSPSSLASKQGGTPGATAVTAVDATLTYAELEEKSNQLAAYLRQFDIQPDTLIGLALPRNSTMLVAILGIFKAGAAYLPIDPSYPPQRVQYMLEHAQAPLLITNAELVDTLPANTRLKPSSLTPIGQNF